MARDRELGPARRRLTCLNAAIHAGERTSAAGGGQAAAMGSAARRAGRPCSRSSPKGPKLCIGSLHGCGEPLREQTRPAHRRHRSSAGSMSADYARLLDRLLGALMHVEFKTDRREIVGYAVVLLLEVDGERETVRLDDGTHGENELHIQIHARGHKAAGRDLPPRYPCARHARRDRGDRARISNDDRVVAQAMSKGNGRSPAARVMDDAIELAIEERSPYPDRATFLDADEPNVGAEIRRAADEGRAIVLVAADGSTRTLLPELLRQ